MNNLLGKTLIQTMLVYFLLVNRINRTVAFVSTLSLMGMALSAGFFNLAVWGEANPLPKDLFQGGGPNNLRPGAPIPGCNSESHQGPPNDDIEGCFDTPVDPKDKH